jgi:aminoglycoside phosphotransferase (APT) family kinase protein
VRADLDSSQLRELDALVGELPALLEALYSSGLEDGLVHGDFHPGNHRFDGRRLVLLDWGDSGIGHPLLDMTAFMERIPTGWHKYVWAVWARAWRGSVAETEFARAAELIRPVGALRQAIIYCRFLDAIEPSEHVYHREDPAAWLRTAIELAASRQGGR